MYRIDWARVMRIGHSPLGSGLCGLRFACSLTRQPGRGSRDYACRKNSCPVKEQLSMHNKEKGFSLIELLIVVAIILIIAAIAIPNLLRSKMASNEASAVSALRTINTSSVAYSTTYGQYPGTLGSLGPMSGTSPTSTTADLIDSVLAAGIKSGYNITFTGTVARGVVRSDKRTSKTRDQGG